MRQFLEAQDGVVARRQLIAAGLDEHDVKRLVRRKELAPVHPGVYVDHTGEPSWMQRAWAAVLYAWPAALAGSAALRATDGQGPDDIDVVVAHDRRVRPRVGFVVERRRGLDAHVLWNLRPPRLRYEEAVLDVATSASTDLDAIAVLAAACGRRRTTAARLAGALRDRSRVPRRAWVEAVIDDIGAGTCSVLEHGYLRRVERAHGLPSARRQLRALASSGPVYRDAEVAGLLVVELDGRTFHDTATARDRDMERDLDASLDGRTTVRLGWGQVFDRPCGTAVKVAALLGALGWEGSPHPCGPSCAVSGNIAVTR
jgi:hypothetical protein